MVLEKQILMFLNIAHNSVKQCMSEVFQKGGFNLTPEQFLVMDTLWDEGADPTADRRHHDEGQELHSQTY